MGSEDGGLKLKKIKQSRVSETWLLRKKATTSTHCRFRDTSHIMPYSQLMAQPQCFQSKSKTFDIEI